MYQAVICPVINQEATALGKSTTIADDFCSAMAWIAKHGSYQYAPTVPYAVARGRLSLTGVPYKASNDITPQYFVFGEFVDGTVINGGTESKAVNTARDRLYQEGLQDSVI